MKKKTKRKTKKDSLPLFEENIKSDVIDELQQCIHKYGLDGSPEMF